MPIIHWESAPTVSQDGRDANLKVIETLGLPLHAGSGRLAVIGGGPSIRDHLDELKNWDGAIWAVNGTINWCIDNGIPAWFYTADAAPMANWTYDLSRVSRAALAPDVSPELVDYLLKHGAEITLTAPIESGPTSANASDYLSLKAGYTQITYFGCEGSFQPQGTHAFTSHPIPDWIEVIVGGEHFRTKPEFISQSIMLANVLRELPEVYAEKSGGLLRAMVQHGPAYEEHMVSHSLYAKLQPKEAA